MDYIALTKRLVEGCLDKGADQAEVYLETGRNLRIDVRNGEIETVQDAASHGVGFRVFVNGRMAFASCNDFSDSAMENAMDRAIGFAASTTADENNVLPDDKGLTDVSGLYDPQIAQVTMDRKIELAKEVEKLAMKDPRITKSGGSGYNEGEAEVYLANSNGLSKSFRETACSFGVYVVAEKGDQKSAGGENCQRRFFQELKTPKEIADKAAKQAYEMLDPKMVKTQEAAVIFDPDVSRAVLGGILAAVDGERVLQGASFLADKKDQQIASELVTIIDDGTRSKGLASRPFDGEGVPTQKRVIVEKGVLKGFMYNTIVARRAGVRSTGNASRIGYQSLPGIGSHNFFMDSGTDDPKDIIKATKKGLYLNNVTGYGIIPVNGNFSGGASGFWVEDGKIAFPVKGLTIAGTAFDMLKAIDMVGSDLDLNRSFTAPTFRIASMLIGGE
jgi:PmbA protein